TVSASGLTAYGQPLGTLTAETRMNKQRVQLVKLNLDKNGGIATAEGEYEIPSRTFSITAEGKDLQIERLPLPNDMPAGATINFSANAGGTVDNPSATLKLRLDDARIQENVIQSVAVDAEIRDHQVRVDAALDTDVSKSSIGASNQLSGRLAATFNASGDLRNLENSEVRAQVPDLKLNWKDKTIVGEGIDLKYAARELTIARA